MPFRETEFNCPIQTVNPFFTNIMHGDKLEGYHRFSLYTCWMCGLQYQQYTEDIIHFKSIEKYDFIIKLILYSFFPATKQYSLI